MRLAEQLARLLARPGFQGLFEQVVPGTCWTDLADEARPVFVSGFWQYLEKTGPPKLFIVTSNHEKVLQWQARLKLCGIPEGQIHPFPSGTSGLFEDSGPETVAVSDRVRALTSMLSDGPAVVIATAPAALERTLPADVLAETTVSISVGTNIEPGAVSTTLERLGYELAETVRVPGQFARRGGLVDMFPIGFDLPVRAEWFGDTIDRLCHFDPMTQRSSASVSGLSLAPGRETVPIADPSHIVELLESALELESPGLAPDAQETLRSAVSSDIACLRRGQFFDRLDLYRPLVHPESECALDFAQDAWVVLDEPDILHAQAESASCDLADALKAREGRGEILRATVLDYVKPAEHLRDQARTLLLGGPEDGAVTVGARPMTAYHKQPVELTKALKNWVVTGQHVVLSTDQPHRATAMLNLVDLYPTTDPLQDAEGGIQIVEGNLAGGFSCEQLGTVLVTDQELFGVARLKLPQRKFNKGVPLATVMDLRPGDHVVHISFGIGIYRGMVQRTVDGVTKEYLHIDYQAPDKLFVPADQLDRIHKYLAPDEAPPKINRLSGGDWRKAVGKARDDAREFARNLIRLYAERKRVTRKPYGSDSPLQEELEHTFPWVETPSQVEAIDAVKRDLETDYPMDRLVCGDVGFGKTEVAVRAAFKVAQSGRQVAMLCPTTILSEQHFRTFQERLAGFDLRVEFINRFRTGKERQEVVQGLESGDVDVVVGTHALLAAKLKFKDLGLLIIDEEQKFGVKHKEAMKSLRTSVDVLILSATPIPRTLSMALTHIRPMSLINDPPPGRLPIRTHVKSFGTEIVREALLRELARDGQVFYVYNKVQGIYHVADKIKKLVPHANVAVAHGQMHEDEIEPVMLGFLNGEVDVLVSTTIVESGLDIPNANTMIVENADRFGLAQLYQLRGRVGRSDRQAYAYFLYPGSRELTENALARLRALQEFSSLGSGYSLAFRDLQIRGAGDLLGASQSGNMHAIGFDLYSQLIESEAEYLRSHVDGEERPDYDDPLAGLEPLPVVDLPVEALIPSTYIQDESQRLFSYRSLMSCRDPQALADVSSELEDRFGRLPKQVLAAVSIMELRIQARALQVEKIEAKGGRVLATFRQDNDHSPRVFTVLTKSNGQAYLSQDQLVWPFASDPVLAASSMLDVLKASIFEVERQRSLISR